MLPQLIIDGREQQCPDYETREDLEEYLRERMEDIGRSIISIQFHPNTEKVSRMLLVELSTVERTQTVGDVMENLNTILEDAAEMQAKASESVEIGTDTVVGDVGNALECWDGLLSGMEILRTVLSEKEIRDFEPLLNETAGLLEKLQGAVDDDDSEEGTKLFDELAGKAMDWKSELGNLDHG